ncbi:hypothetical protein FRC10_011025 [Ceratobasidium sp. 414]|nr:hypothetical protein FRC10_011025 [Ceratobasidium sp. 414]
MTSGDFHFMKQSKLDVPTGMSESQEWVTQPTTNPEYLAVEVARAQVVIREVPSVEAETGGDVAEGLRVGT